MKYTKEQRLDIGRRIYDRELSRYEAANVDFTQNQSFRHPIGRTLIPFSVV